VHVAFFLFLFLFFAVPILCGERNAKRGSILLGHCLQRCFLPFLKPHVRYLCTACSQCIVGRRSIGRSIEGSVCTVHRHMMVSLCVLCRPYPVLPRWIAGLAINFLCEGHLLTTCFEGHERPAPLGRLGVLLWFAKGQKRRSR
jgi:hypothetical protein